MPKKALVSKNRLSERQAKILAAIVREFSSNPVPVGSEEINKKYNFNISSATIRNEMMALEKMGYIEQPHTSAGRVPTDFGYRYFVNELMKRFELTFREQQSLREQLLKLQAQHQELGRNIAKLLADKTEQAAFALLPEDTSATGLSNIFAHPNIDKAKIYEAAQFFDNIDEYADKMLTEFLEAEPEAVIGKENQLMKISNYSLVVSPVKLPSGKKGLIGVLGPKSMRYDKNMTIVEYIAKLLSSGTLMLLLINLK